MCASSPEFSSPTRFPSFPLCFSFSFFAQVDFVEICAIDFSVALGSMETSSIVAFADLFFYCIAAPDLTNLSGGTDSILGPGKVHTLCSFSFAFVLFLAFAARNCECLIDLCFSLQKNSFSNVYGFEFSKLKIKRLWLISWRFSRSILR